MTVLVSGTVVGSASLAPVFAAREARAWRSLSSSACSEPTTVRDCDGFRDFQSRFGNGEHGPEARRILEEAAPKLARLADEDAWRSSARDAADACVSKKLEEPSEIELACAPVATYLNRFPEGLHAKEADAALKKGRARVAALIADAERKERAKEEAARQRAASEHARRVGACKNACISQCKTNAANFPACLSACQGRCN